MNKTDRASSGMQDDDGATMPYTDMEMALNPDLKLNVNECLPKQLQIYENLH
jgi:hypothetical protein